MTTTEQYTIHEVIQMIEGGEIKLPIFQRRYVWSKKQVENLFSTVFNDNPFGAISAIKTTDDYPIFASRTFFEDLKDKYQLSESNDGQNHSKDNPLYLILDGQQRLQSFYLGLTSKYDDMELCFNKQEGTFKFCTEYDKKECISVKQLYKKIWNNTYENVAQNFNAENVEIVNKNIFKFYYHFFFQKRIVMLLAYPHNKDKGNVIKLREDKNNLFELFVKLNTGGINLDIYEIYASKLKAHNSLWEKLFIKIDQEFNKIVYYPYSLPFRNITNMQGRTPRNQFDYLEGYISFIPVLYYCFNNKFLPRHQFHKISDDCIEIMCEALKDDNEVNRLFDFICIIFDLCRIISIPEPILGAFINKLYIKYISNKYEINIQDFTIDYYLSDLYQRHKSKFANLHSFELFVFKYFLLDDITNEDYDKIRVLNCQYNDDSQTFEIQMNENEGNVKISLYEFFHTSKYLLKYADSIIENTLKTTIIDFKQKWEERAKQSSEWKTLNDNYKNNHKI